MRILPRLALAAFAFAPLLDAPGPGPRDDAQSQHDAERRADPARWRRRARVRSRTTRRCCTARSRDGGRTWPLREAVVGQALLSRYEIVVAGPGQLVVLATSVNTEPTYWRSGDAGTTWSPTAPLFPGSFGLGQVALTAHGPQVLAVRLSGAGQLSVRRSLDGGATWLPEQVLADLHLDHRQLPLLCAHTAASSTWSGRRTGPGGWQGMNQRSLDGGATWLPLPRIVGVGFSGLVSDGTNLLVRVASTELQRSTDVRCVVVAVFDPRHAARRAARAAGNAHRGGWPDGPGTRIRGDLQCLERWRRDVAGESIGAAFATPDHRRSHDRRRHRVRALLRRPRAGPAGHARWWGRRGSSSMGRSTRGFAPSSQRTLHLNRDRQLPVTHQVPRVHRRRQWGARQCHAGGRWHRAAPDDGRAPVPGARPVRCTWRTASAAASRC